MFYRTKQFGNWDLPESNTTLQDLTNTWWYSYFYLWQRPVINIYSNAWRVYHVNISLHSFITSADHANSLITWVWKLQLYAMVWYSVQIQLLIHAFILIKPPFSVICTSRLLLSCSMFSLPRSIPFLSLLASHEHRCPWRKTLSPVSSVHDLPLV